MSDSVIGIHRIEIHPIESDDRLLTWVLSDLQEDMESGKKAKIFTILVRSAKILGQERKKNLA